MSWKMKFAIGFSVLWVLSFAGIFLFFGPASLVNKFIGLLVSCSPLWLGWMIVWASQLPTAKERRRALAFAGYPLLIWFSLIVDMIVRPNKASVEHRAPTSSKASEDTQREIQKKQLIDSGLTYPPKKETAAPGSRILGR
jgi:hypothetical protein